MRWAFAQFPRHLISKPNAVVIPFLFHIDTSEVILILAFVVTGGLIAPISLLRYRYSTHKTKLWFYVNIPLAIIMIWFIIGVIRAWLFPS